MLDDSLGTAPPVVAVDDEYEDDVMVGAVRVTLDDSSLATVRCVVGQQ